MREVQSASKKCLQESALSNCTGTHKIINTRINLASAENVQACLPINWNRGASFCLQEYQLLRLTKKIFLYVINLTNLLGIISKDEVPFLPVYFCF